MRKTKNITIESGRDKGKTFKITEMPAAQADNWAMRALFAMANSGFDSDYLPAANLGMAGMVQMTLAALAKVKPQDGIPLLNELLECAEIIPDGGNPRPINHEVGDIEDFTTYLTLRKEVFKLHTDFLQSALGSIWDKSDTSESQLST